MDLLNSKEIFTTLKWHLGLKYFKMLDSLNFSSTKNI